MKTYTCILQSALAHNNRTVVSKHIDMILYLLVRSAPRAYIMAFGYPADWIVIDVYVDGSMAYRDAIIMNSREPWVYRVIAIEVRA